MLPILLFTSCSKDDDLVIETQVLYIAKNTYSGDNTITGTFFFFKDGDYDPTTFKCDSYREDATIKNQKGETIKCDPGTYYVVALVKNRSFGQLWKAQKIQVEKNKITRIDAVFGNMSAEGYVEWNN